MLVFEATTELQGVRDTDYCWTEEGELVHLPALDCASPTCGCSRGFAGFKSHRATTTARVVERPDLTMQDFRKQLAASLHAAGWIPALDASDALVNELSAEIAELASRFGLRAIVEREGDIVTHRLLPGIESVDASMVDQLDALERYTNDTP